MKLSPCLLLIVICVCVDCSIIGRDKRRFKSSVADRIGHGFGKRQGTAQDNLYPPQNTRHVLTTRKLAKLLSDNTLLAYIVAEKYVDRNGDGLISTDELLFDQMGES